MRIVIILLTMSILLLLINSEFAKDEDYCDKVREEYRSSCFYFKQNSEVQKMGGFMNDDEWLDVDESFHEKILKYQKSVGAVLKMVDGKLVHVDPDGVLDQESHLEDKE